MFNNYKKKKKIMLKIKKNKLNANKKFNFMIK